MVLMDMGSAVMTTEMCWNPWRNHKVKMVDCPLVEGAVAGTIAAAGGQSLDLYIPESDKIRIFNNF